MSRLTYKYKNKRYLIQLCLDNKLFVRGFSLEKDFKYLLNCNLRSYKDWVLIVAFVNNKPVAVIASFGIIMFYVKPEYRRQGIATKLYKKLKTLRNIDYTISGEGVKGSKQFFQSIKQSYYKREDCSIVQF
jgi:ribosomal protein S18 acetylase RimI-like enzyme